MKELHNIKKVGGLLILAAAMVFGAPKVGLESNVYAANNMGMSNTHWAAPYLQNLYAKGIIRGDLDGSLNPDRNITRAEFVSIVNRAFGYNDKGKIPFKDIKGNEWYSDDVNIAYNEGYFFGNGKNISGAQNKLTREQAVSLLCRNLCMEEKSGENFNFKDSRTFDSWSRGAINAASGKKVITGYQDGTFRPQNQITRGEVAKMFSSAIGELISTPTNTSFGYVNGNMTISSSGVTLRDTVISGDLYITKGVGLGFTTLDNVRVLGEVIVSGAGESNVGKSSIVLKDSHVDTLIMNGPKDKTITLKVEGNTVVNKTIVKSNTYLEELARGGKGFQDIELKGEPETQLHLSGDFNKVTIKKPKNLLFLDKGDIADLTVDEEAPTSSLYFEKDTYVKRLYLDIGTKVTGNGDIGDIRVHSNGCVVEQLPDLIEIRPGVVANINGQNMTSNDAEVTNLYPRILGSYPKMEDVGVTEATAIYKTNKNGELYWVLSLSADRTVSTEDILKPWNKKEIIKSGKISILSSKETSIIIKGLKADEEYTLSAILVDNKKDESARKRETFKTADNSTPNFLSGYPKVIAFNNNGADVVVIPTKNCKVYWAVYNKGSVAPTDFELKKEALHGYVQKGTASDCKKNVQTIITIAGLPESKEYDIYLMATDGTNDSKVSKLPLKTLDKTAPEFLRGYPKPDKSTDKSVSIKVGINEAGTVYYVVRERGSVFPTPVPPSITSPSLDSEATKQEVVTGNNSTKSGKTNVAANKEGLLSISGLKPETSYDVYLAAQDKDKNTSKVEKLYIKTTDVIPPTAIQKFELEINGDPLVESDIQIVFSEEVWDAATLKPLTIEDLEKNIALYDLSTARRSRVALDYKKVVLELKDGKTVVTFPKDATKLNSGNKYEFEINKIVDTSNNKMNEKTLLPAFDTVAPLVELVKTVAPEEMDMTFELSPQAVQTADSVLFDLIFESNTTITFELYEKDSQGLFKNINDNPKYSPFVMAGEATTLHYMLDRKMQEQKDYTFEKFNQLKKREYGIKIKKINTSSEREGWSNTVKIGVKCVTGSKTNLSIVAGNPKNGLNTAIKEGAVLVHYPQKFELLASFTDTVVPSFITDYPKLGEGQIGDTLIRPLIRTEKMADFYYLIAPTGVVSNPSALDIMSGALKPQGSVRGKYQIISPNTEFEVLIEGLVEKENYTMYCFLKGTPPETSPIKEIHFQTKSMSPPVITRAEVSDKGENFVKINLSLDKGAVIDWIIFNKTSQPSIITADIIRDREEEASYKPIDFGSVTVRGGSSESEAKVTITCKNLKKDAYYTFYAIAKSPLGGGDSIIKEISGITPADRTPPTVEAHTTIISCSTDKEGVIVYNGSLTLRFNEPMYYIVDKEEGLKPLTLSAFGYGLRVSGTDIESVNIPTISIESYATEPSPLDPKDRILKTVEIKFKNVYHNAVIGYENILTDEHTNIAGRLELIFRENGIRDSFWEKAFY